MIHLLTLGISPYSDPEYEGHFRHNALFIGANVRKQSTMEEQILLLYSI